VNNNQVLIFRNYEFLTIIKNVPDHSFMKQVLDAYAEYCDVDVNGLSGIWLFPGSDIDFKELQIQ
jgi:hypothetical protein